MASASLVPYKNNTSTVTFSVVTTSLERTTYKVSGRGISTPFSLEISRKLSSGKSNDHVSVRIAQQERNASTTVIATGQVLLDISIPKDQSIVTNGVMVEMLGLLASVLNDSAALAATTASRTALVEGRDL